MSEWLTAAGIVVAASVGTFGYLYSQAHRDSERTARLFAEALSAVQLFRFVPFRVRRRADSETATRKELADFVTLAQDGLDSHTMLLELEAPRVASVYRELVSTARQEVDRHTKHAWTKGPVTSDEGMNMGLGATYDTPETRKAIQTCIGAMNTELKWRSAWWRRRR